MPIWKSHRLSVPKDVEYKYVVVKAKCESKVKWEQVENHTILCTPNLFINGGSKDPSYFQFGTLKLRKFEKKL